MVIFTSSGDMIVQRKNVDACQWIEYSAMLVKQYCKETQNRDNRIYDLRGVSICNMAGDLKEFVKGYLSCSSTKNFNNHISSSLITEVHDALEIFSEVYNSGSSKKYAEKLEEEFPAMFKYMRIVNMLLSELVKRGIVVTQHISASSSSVYLDLDYKNLTSIRISDHYTEYDGFQLIMADERPAEAGSGGVYNVKPSFTDEEVMKVIGFIVNRVSGEREAKCRSQYIEYLKSRKAQYKEENPNFQGVEM